VTETPLPLAVVIVTGLSGGGKASVLRALEDVGYEAVDNPPLEMLEDMVARGDAKLAVGIDARTRGFDTTAVLQTIARLRANPALQVSLVYTWADEAILLRRFTETRRRHPLVPQGLIADGIAAELEQTAGLRYHADLVLDTSNLTLAGLRRVIEQRYGAGTDSDETRMVVSLMSFAYPRGLPPEADLVFDARFLRNPHYDPILRARTGIDPAVAAYIESDPDFADYFARLAALAELILPRFVQEGKKYATITIGCTGGRHRSVHLIEKLAKHLTSCTAATHGAVQSELDGGTHWRLHVTHRELVREGMQGEFPTVRPVAHHAETDLDNVARTLTVHPQEA
jgi:RNase adapter protein RapZ